MRSHWRLGVGRRLVQTPIDWGWNAGHLRKINLRVRPDNWAAIRLDRQLGFNIEGGIRREYRLGGKVYDIYYRMGLMLATNPEQINTSDDQTR